MRQIIKKFDLVCLGGGAASLLAARRAAQYGKTACIIEQGKIGGVCLTKGCIPKKLLYSAAQVYRDAVSAAEYGVWTNKQSKKENELNVDIKVLQSKIHEFVEMASRSVESICLQSGVEVLKGQGKFIEPKVIQLQETDPEIIVYGEKVLIATGGAPYIPSIPGIEKTINSDTLYDLTAFPESLLIVGADYIGIESASLMNNFGVKTTVCMREKRILSKFDPEIASVAMEHLQSRGIMFQPDSDVSSIENLGKCMFRVKTKEGKALEAEAVMMAVGRRPNTRGLGLSRIGIKVGDGGEIITDEYDSTSQPGVYALGDVAGKSSLATVAKVASKLLVDRLFGPGAENKEAYKVDYESIPSAVFCDPPVTRCGMLESEAIKIYGEKGVKVYKQQGYQLAHALVESKDPMMVKIITAEMGGKEVVVGAHAMGRGVEEVINGFALAMKKQLTKEDLEKAIPIHPTVGEEFLNLF